jgi:hypothetical protein
VPRGAGVRNEEQLATQAEEIAQVITDHAKSLKIAGGMPTPGWSAYPEYMVNAGSLLKAGIKADRIGRLYLWD